MREGAWEVGVDFGDAFEEFGKLLFETVYIAGLGLLE